MVSDVVHASGEAWPWPWPKPFRTPCQCALVLPAATAPCKVSSNTTTVAPHARKWSVLFGRLTRTPKGTRGQHAVTLFSNNEPPSCVFSHSDRYRDDDDDDNLGPSAKRRGKDCPIAFRSPEPWKGACRRTLVVTLSG